MILIKNERLKAVLRVAIPFVLIPLTAILGTLLFDEKRHLFISFFIAILSVALFILSFEKKKTGTRRTVLVAVMIALSIVGRFIPFFKPVTAITVIAAIYLGGEAGFLVGSLSALISNFYFGQGPWTAFQMLAWGLIGLFAGFLSKPLKKSRIALIIYGVASGILFSLVMDIWTALWYNDSFDPAIYSALVVTALPHTVLYAVSNLVFLYLLSKPLGEKLERVKIKYGV